MGSGREGLGVGKLLKKWEKEAWIGWLTDFTAEAFRALCWEPLLGNRVGPRLTLSISERGVTRQGGVRP